jgi:Arc/MetJ family transcription regulator
MGIHAKFIGSGNLFVRDTSGNAYEAGVLKDVTYDFSSEFKGLKGEQLVDVLVAEIGRTYTLTAKYAQYNSALRDALDGAVVTTGSKRISTQRKTAAASSATVATADDGTPAGWAFITDLGVKYAATGQPLKYNSGTLATTGEYKNTAGVYTLGTGDATASVDITYVYSVTAGQTATTSNRNIGISTFFAVYTYRQTTQADGTVARIFHHFPAALFTGDKSSASQADWSETDVEIKLFPDASGYIGYRTTQVG